MTYEELKNAKVSDVIAANALELLESIKSYIGVTWNEEDDDIRELVMEGMQYLNEKTGEDINYNKDYVARGLLKDYCRYTRNYSKEFFEENFLTQITGLQYKYATKEIESIEGDTNAQSKT